MILVMLERLACKPSLVFLLDENLPCKGSQLDFSCSSQPWHDSNKLLEDTILRLDIQQSPIAMTKNQHVNIAWRLEPAALYQKETETKDRPNRNRPFYRGIYGSIE